MNSKVVSPPGSLPEGSAVPAQERTTTTLRAVFKYPVPHLDVVPILMPGGARILAVDAQGDEVFVWALVDRGVEKEVRRLGIYGTGQPFLGGNYINTFQMHGGALVFHAFDLSGPA